MNLKIDVVVSLQESCIHRSDIFITTKLHPINMGYENTKAAFQKALENLQTDYIGKSYN